VQLDPNNWRRYRDLSQQYLRVKLYSSAVVGFEKALALNPKDASLPFLLGRTYREMGITTRAEGYLKNAAALGVSGAEINREFSFVYQSKGDFGPAAEIWKKTLTPTSSEEDIGRLIALAGLAHDRKMAEEALATLKKGGASAETIAFYQSLIDVPAQEPDAVLALKTTNPHMKILLENIVK
jgi:tetratricopeptide (TPR) repeat protein